MPKKCKHEIVSTYEPFFENGNWNFKKWHGECFNCGKEGVYEKWKGFTPVNLNRELKKEIQACLDAGKFEEVKPDELIPGARKWTKNRVLDAMEKGLAHGFTMTGPGKISAFRLHDKKLGKKAAETALKGLTRE